MTETAKLNLEGKDYEFDITVGSENEKCIDITKLRSETGYITMDQGFGNTGSTFSSITYVDGANGILRYRGYSIEELANNSTFLETTYLILYGELPSKDQLQQFSSGLREHAPLHTNLEHHIALSAPQQHKAGDYRH